ncbi:sphingosine kinase 1-like [Astyanax mexicanus]|uniref:sphingosine kinase n=1 Tax=Astyanax mexicanus TaxID=7994 RepID=A0A8T2M3M5_ASTMX|nr:sphingosine kinase 1-like [Astyanax mexicanus]
MAARAPPSRELRAEFTDPVDEEVKLAVTLTDSSLTVRRISLLPSSPSLSSSSPTSATSSSSPSLSSPLVLSLSDCVGCLACVARDEDGGDGGALVCAYFYPRVRRRWAGGVARAAARHRVEQRLRVACGGDAAAELREAERWAGAVTRTAARHAALAHGGHYSQVCRMRRLMVLVNPLSGKGQAMALYTGPIHRMLTEAAVPHTLITTDYQNHAWELVRNADLSQWSAIVILSGDGLLFEVINGLMEREDWEEAIQTPLGILPGGSGNAVAASVHHYTEAGAVFGEDLLLSCGFVLCKGLVCTMDLLSVRLSSGPRLFSFLSLAWGFVADVDIESEKYRPVGAVRFLVGALVRLASLRSYQGRLSFLLAADESSSVTATTNPSSLPGSTFCSSREQHSLQRDPATRTDPKEHGPVDDLMTPLGEPVPTDWTVVEERDFVLVLAMCHSHLAEDLMVAPDARPDDGHIHLFYVTAGVSRPALLRLFLAMEKGTHLTGESPHLVYRRVRALRLEPVTRPGVITVDGEQVEYGPVQAQVHRGCARIISG